MGPMVPCGFNNTAGGLHLHLPRAYLLPLPFEFIYYSGRRWKSNDCQISIMLNKVLLHVLVDTHTHTYTHTN